MLDPKKIILTQIFEGGGGGVEVEPLSVTENGTYTADEGKAYSPVSVSVPSLTAEALSVTENGTYTAPTGKAYSPVTVNVPTGGGGASNVVMGTFTTGSTRDSTGSVSLNYSGSGYPIAAIVYISGGMNNNTSGGNTSWYSSTNRYDVGSYSMTKAETNTTPTYAPMSGTLNYGVVSLIYKNSTTSASSYEAATGANAEIYDVTGPGKKIRCCCFSNKNTLKYYVGNLTSSTIGLAPSTEYAYIVIYSS